MASENLPRPRRRAFDFSTAILFTVVGFCAIYVYRRDGGEVAYNLLLGDLTLFANQLTKVMAGSVIGAFITLLLRREVVTRWVGAESGIAGILVAFFFGAILPGGPFTIYPIAAAFLAIGADAGAAIAFITSWTLLGYSRALIWEMPFFGLDFISWRMLGALPLPILAGILGRFVARLIAARRLAA
jgi:uncharacterized membrane protein YraQ (UPF0718 family)